MKEREWYKHKGNKKSGNFINHTKSEEKRNVATKSHTRNFELHEQS